METCFRVEVSSVKMSHPPRAVPSYFNLGELLVCASHPIWTVMTSCEQFLMETEDWSHKQHDLVSWRSLFLKNTCQKTLWGKISFKCHKISEGWEGGRKGAWGGGGLFFFFWQTHHFPELSYIEYSKHSIVRKRC